MRGAPWQGLFYAFVLEAVIAIGAFMYALESRDFLSTFVAWGLVLVLTVAAVRTVRRAARQGESRDRSVGRWWFNG